MNTRIYRLLILPTLSFALSLALTQSLSAQVVFPQTGRETVRTGTDSVPVLPFPASGILEAYNASGILISESANKQLTEEQVAGYLGEVDTLLTEIDQFLGDSMVITLKGTSVRELNQISLRVGFWTGRTDQLQERLSRVAGHLEDATLALLNNRQRWQLTLETGPEEEVTEARGERIGRTIHRLDSVRGLLQEDLAFILEGQGRLADKRSQLAAVEVRIKEKKAALGESLLSRDMPNFFKDLGSLGDSTLIPDHIRQLRKNVGTDWNFLTSDYSAPMIIASLVLILFLVVAIWYKRHFARMISVEKFELSEMHMAITYSPFVTVVFAMAVLIRFIMPDLPQTFSSLNLVIMMIPMMIIVIRLFGSQVRTWIMVLVIVYSLTFVYELSYNPDIYLRLILMLFSIAGLWLFIWIYIKRPLSQRYSDNIIYKAFRILLLIFAVLLFLAVIANLVGAFRLAEFFTLLPIQLAVLAIGIHVTSKVADTIVFLLLASNYLQKFNVIRDEFQVIYRKIVWLIDFLLIIFFFTTALRIFRLKDAFYEWGRGVLTEGWKIGAVDITPGSILIFVFVIWLSVMITRIVRHVLEKDVFVRVKTGKGVPSTIILLIRIVLISGGFFLAAAAAGMELTNLSIVLGAFSVGIGFGLQNIFNNMVSGLILAFERPIKVGDVVQVGELMGTVRSIGLRSSTVKSFDGAEVIVPNGNLISNEMINWTLSDSNRRMDIRVGVAYGTDPELVISLLEKTATENERVDKKPSPKAYFLGFGESSLDFRLLAWVDIEYRLETESELNVAVNAVLKESNIEIPFPQRDLHVRSDATKPAPAGKAGTIARGKK